MITRDPVVRATREVPISDRRIKGNGFAIENQFPIGRCERRHNLPPTCTTTAMHCGSVGDGHIENAIVEHLGNELDEFMVELLH